MVKMTSVWEATVDFLRDHAAAWMPVTAGLVLLPNVVSGMMGEGTAASPMTALRGVLAVALTVVTLWGGAAITALAIRPSRPGFAVAHAGRRLPAIVGVTLILILAAVALVMPFAIILSAGGVDLEALAAPTPAMPAIGGGTAIALFAYGLLLSVGMLWITARLCVLVPVILAERRGIGAIRRAWSLTRGHGWRLVGVFLLYGIVALILSGAVGAVTGLIGIAISGGAPGFGAGTIIVALAMGIVAALLTLVQSAFVGRLYAALAPADDLGETFA